MVMACEADQVELQALTASFRVNLLVAYVDGSPGPLVLHPFVQRPSTDATDMALLYRPGHYDLLYTQATLPSR